MRQRKASKTLYLHVGLRKTGTSSLQIFFGLYRDILQTRYGLYYPLTGTLAELTSGVEFQGSTVFPLIHRHLFPTLDHDLWTRLAAEAAEHPDCDLLLSEEDVSRLIKQWTDQDWAEKIRSYFPDYDLKIILYVRRIDDSLKSMYNQDFKGLFQAGGNCPQYAGWFEEIYRKEPEKIFSSLCLEAFIKSVGCDNVIIRIFDRASLKNGNIIDDFFDIFGIDLGDIPRNIVSNPAYPNKMYAFATDKMLTVDNEMRRLILEQVENAFLTPKAGSAGAGYKLQFEEEIKKIDALIPGYKKLFNDRECDFGLPELDLPPEVQLHFSLIFLLFNNLEKTRQSILNETHAHLVEQFKQQLHGRHSTFGALKSKLGRLFQFFKSKPE